jgi:hypothetical protein
MVIASTPYFHIKTRHELSIHMTLIIEWQQPLRRPGQVIDECMRHFVVDVQGIKLMGLSRLQSVASVLGDSTFPAATTVTLNSHLLFQSPELKHDHIYPQHPKFPGEEIIQSERRLKGSDYKC